MIKVLIRLYDNMEKEAGIWLTNITKKDIYLPDLNIRVKSMKSMNLLPMIMQGKLEAYEIEKSINEGFLFKNKGKIFYRFNQPEKLVPDRSNSGLSNKPLIKLQRSFVNTTEEIYEELNIPEEAVINDEIKEYEEK